MNHFNGYHPMCSCEVCRRIRRAKMWIQKNEREQQGDKMLALILFILFLIVSAFIHRFS